MSSDEDDRSVHDVEQEMQDEAGRMQRRVDELGDHVQEAEKKQNPRQNDDLPDEEVLETVAGDAADRTTSSDDPTSAIGDPEKADED